MQDATHKGLTRRQKTILSGMGAYATHYGIPFNEWQADRLMFKQNQANQNQKQNAFIDYKK